jgi:hypothetical protein
VLTIIPPHLVAAKLVAEGAIIIIIMKMRRMK